MPRPYRGFTLVELLVVLVLMSVLAGSAVVMLQGRDRPHALGAAAEDLAAALRYARASADLTARRHCLVFGDGQRSYWVEVHEGEGVFVSATGTAGRPRSFPAYVTLQPIEGLSAAEGSASRGLWFEPGTEPKPVTLRLVSDDGQRRDIVRLAGTGQVRIETPPVLAGEDSAVGHGAPRGGMVP